MANPDLYQRIRDLMNNTDAMQKIKDFIYNTNAKIRNYESVSVSAASFNVSKQQLENLNDKIDNATGDATDTSDDANTDTPAA
jgi:hypothetical protein